jgi:hypothetical protein
MGPLSKAATALEKYADALAAAAGSGAADGTDGV